MRFVLGQEIDWPGSHDVIFRPFYIMTHTICGRINCVCILPPKWYRRAFKSFA